MKEIGPVYHLVSVSKHSTKKQEQIRGAAIELFSQKGYASTSTSEIAIKANVAEGTIFRHYRTKKDLLYSIVLPVMDDLLSQFFCYVDELKKNNESPEYFIKKSLQGCRALIERNLLIIKILLQEMPFHNSLREAFVVLMAGKPLSTFKEVVENYQMNGKLRNDLSSIAMIRLAGSSIVSYLMMSLVNNTSADSKVSEIEIEQIIELVMRGIESR